MPGGQWVSPQQIGDENQRDRAGGTERGHQWRAQYPVVIQRTLLE